MASTTKMLVVDAQQSDGRALCAQLKRLAYDAVLSTSADMALQILARQDIALVITDLHLPGVDGLKFIRQLTEQYPQTKIIVATTFGTIKTAVAAIKAGACDFITKPVQFFDIKLKISDALRQQEDKTHPSPKPSPQRPRHAIAAVRGAIVGSSDKMQAVLSLVEKVADSDSTVLIRGESGTGKELIARAIHDLSPRHDKPFIRLNTAAMPVTLLESELFGHERGAFTGAIRRKLGKFELAKDGTIFLDEIGDISPTAQVKLLRVLQERNFERVGGHEVLKVECRILAATNQPLEEKVRAGTFREDLYYRLNVVPIFIPPLRNRKQDLPDLVAHFLNKYSRRRGHPPMQLPAESMQELMDYDWAGNVRELENVIERAVVMGGVTLEAKPNRSKSTEGQWDFELGGDTKLSEYLANIEQSLVRKAISQSGGNRTHAAALLGMDRNLLRYKMKKYDIEA